MRVQVQAQVVAQVQVQAQAVAQALAQAQDLVQVRAQEQVQALGLALAQVEALAQALGEALEEAQALAQAQRVAQEWDLQGQARPAAQKAVRELLEDYQARVLGSPESVQESVQELVRAEEQVEVLEPWERPQVVRELELG